MIITDRAKTAFVLGLRYLFLTRFSWLSGLLLLCVAPVSLSIAPKLLANLFVLDSPLQLIHVSWITMWSAATVMETMRVTTLNADARFDDYQDAATRFREAWGSETEETNRDWYRRTDGWVTFVCGFFAALAVWFVMADACVTSIARDPAPAWTVLPGANTESQITRHAWTYAYRGLGVAIAAWLTLSAAAIYLHELSNRRWLQGRELPFNKFFCALHRVLGPGYFRPDESGERMRLAPGHFSVLCYSLSFIGWYSFTFVTATELSMMPTESSPYPALFYFLLSLLLAIYLFPGMSFFLDRYRIPTALAPVLGMVLFYNVFDTDHYYHLNPAPARNSHYQPPVLTDVLDDWWLPLDREGKRTLVVVDASGGGIQASAWTAQVLTGLHELYGEPFTRSVGLVSSVSGGSVGSMFYLANRAEAQNQRGSSETVLDAEAIERIRMLSRSSALEASAWGLAYADAMRAAFPPAVHEDMDRGWAVERVWRQRMAEHIKPTMADWRLSDMGRASKERQLPIAVFNATIMETGERILISPVLAPPCRFPQPHRPVQWMEEFPESHPYTATAARLSATFPYVSPAARSDASGGRIAGHHLVDGAYVDNEGVVTSVDWINKMLSYYEYEGRLEERPFDRILLIRIQAFPQSVEEMEPVSPHRGWRAALTGPLDAMLSVRRTSQLERGDLEINLLARATRSRLEHMKQNYSNTIHDLENDVRSIQTAQRMRKQMIDGNVAPRGQSLADVMRQQMEAGENLEQKQRLVDDLQRKVRRLEQLTFESVMFDFQSPSSTRIPLSWKLTESQKRNIDTAWRALARGKHPHDPLRTLGKYFNRVDSPSRPRARRSRMASGEANPAR